MPFGQIVYVQQNMLRSIKASFLPAINSVLLSFFVPVVIVVTVFKYRYRLIRFLYPRLHFIEQGISQIFYVAENPFSVLILLCEIFYDLIFSRTFFEVFIHPVIVIDATVAMHANFNWNFFGNRWFK